MSLGFERSPNEHTLYVREVDDGRIFVSLHVDDLLVTGTDSTRLLDFKKELYKEFEMTDLGEMSFFLGMEVWQSSNGIFISQEKYANELLKKFAMENCKPVNTPLMQNLKLCKNDGDAKVDETKYRSIVGCLVYLTATRPDIMYAPSLLSRFINEPSELHLQAAKRVLRYIRGCPELGIWFKEAENFSAISWNSKKQEVVAQSTAEAEYVVAAAAVNQLVWLRKFLKDLRLEQTQGNVLHCDNQSAIAMSKNPVLHGRTKHIRIKYHVVREAEQNGEVKTADLENVEKLPMVLDWAIGNESCEAAKMVICQGKSGCIDSKSRTGYLCECLDCYEGNHISLVVAEMRSPNFLLLRVTNLRKPKIILFRSALLRQLKRVSASASHPRE
ncbi:uncharacterized protein LOC116110236 [Pistacia vera]|uniref:uncharacterized protein LOC116110236 n=1 Tax=Pistacia vera TaxID=55513 RepID=UPI0012631F4A|nr:uncharacterized protein LOC116110236 [Pistacia vera]